MGQRSTLLGRLAMGLTHLEQQEARELQRELSRWAARLPELQAQSNSASELFDLPTEVWLFLLLKQKLEKEERRLFKLYVRYLSEEMKLQVDPEEVFTRRREVRLALFPEKKTVSLPHSLTNGKYKHLVLHGRAANIILKKRELQEGEGDLIRLSEVQASLDKLCILEYYRERLKLPRFPKGLTLAEYLLQPLQEKPLSKSPAEEPTEAGEHKQDGVGRMQENVEFEVASVSSQVYNHMLILDAPTVVMSVPCEAVKLEIGAFLRNSELCVYLNETSLLQQEVRKNSFYRNYELKGINFVAEGEVECHGRHIARGWVVRGRAKSAGFSWQFPPVFFFKFIAYTPSVWKQFVHDMDLNGEIPFRIERVLEETLGLSQEPKSKQNALLALATDRRDPKLPEIRSMSKNKMQQLGRLKHWDERITDISEFKRGVLNHRLKDVPKHLSPMNIDLETAARHHMQPRPPNSRGRAPRNKHMGSQRSISHIEGARSQRSIEINSERKANNRVNNGAGSFLLTREEESDRYAQQASNAHLGSNQQSERPFELYRRESVLITSVLQRLSSLNNFQTDEQHPIARHEFMNVRLVRHPESQAKAQKVRPRYGRPSPSPSNH